MLDRQLTRQCLPHIRLAFRRRLQQSLHDIPGRTIPPRGNGTFDELVPQLEIVFLIIDTEMCRRIHLISVSPSFDLDGDDCQSR